MEDVFILQKKTDIGLIRQKNEDAVLALSHPKNEKIKLLAVADGMGGRDLGDVASNYIINNLKKWFLKYEVDKFNDIKQISKTIKELILELNRQLILLYGENRLGTTLTLALINDTDTLILNIGDSRCYTYKNEILKQITDDDSQVWIHYKTGKVKKEDLRFFSTSNLIIACIGINEELCKINTDIIDNNSYDIILLLTDGVTDLLTDAKIKELIEQHKKTDILDRMIQEAVYVDQKLEIPMRLKRNFKEPFYVPSNGKDNASGVIYIKNNK